MAGLMRCGPQLSAVLCKTCSTMVFLLEQPRVGAGDHWFKTGPTYDIIKHLYILIK